MPKLMLRGDTMYEAVCNELKLYQEENEELKKELDAVTDAFDKLVLEHASLIEAYRLFTRRKP